LNLARVARSHDYPFAWTSGGGAAGIPFFRIGIPVFDRLGAGHQVTVGYRGTRDLIFTVGNLLMANGHEPTPETWLPPPQDASRLVSLHIPS